MTGRDSVNPLRILHLEDELHDQELVRATFEAEGLACRIQAVSTRETFLAALEQGEFDIVLSDFALPAFDGLSALKLTRERTQDIPVIFLSGTIGEEAAIEAVRSGATDYVLKQRMSRLVPAVRRAMSEAQALHERRQVEASLQREREFSTRLIESSVDGILAFDRGFRVTAWNAGMERMTGLAKDDALGRPAPELFPFILQIGDGALLREAAADQSTIAVDLAFTIAATGRKGFLDAYCSPLRDGSGEVAGWLVIMHDTTKRRGLEEQFRQSQKMDAIGRLAGGVAHDFNNLLTTILGYGQLLSVRLVGQPELLQDLNEIEAAANRAASLTRQLLAMSRQQRLKPQVLDLNGVIVDMDKMLRRLIGEDIDLRTMPTAGLGHVKADPGQVEQVVMNLVVNARDAMPEGGRLTIETTNFVLEADSVGAPDRVAPGSYVMLAVSDTGTGMDAETRGRIFEPFFTTKEVGRGTGLGLSTVHGIVAQSGGHIEVYSEIAHGTTFKVYFPRVDEELEPDHADASRGPARGGREAILVIEDDDMVRGMTGRALRSKGYEVVEAATRFDAWMICDARRRQGRSFDLVVSDVVMPGMGLVELANRLRKAYPTLRVLYMSGYTDRAILGQEHAGAIEHFLQKPFAIEELLTTVRRMLDEPRAAAA